VCRSRINQICQSELVDMSKPLERTRIQNLAFITVHPHENMNRIPDFVSIAIGHSVRSL